MTNRRPWFLATVIPVVLALPSCTAINVNAIPQPGESYRGGHDIVMEFSNVLNLPERAKVVMDGTRVGVVTKVEVSQEAVDVTATVDPLISVPSNINPVLQQATVLGDLYISLERPRDGQAAPALGPAAKIPLAQTTSPPPLEATIANLANFVSSGSIQRIQNTMIGLNRVQPAGGQPALRKLVSQVSADVEQLGENLDTADQWLHGLSQTTQLMEDKIPTFQYWFSPTGMAGFDRMFALGSIIAALFPTVGTYLYSGGYWLVPLLETLSDGVGALQQNKWVFEDEYPAWQRLFTNYFLPQDKHPAINITSIVGPDGRELSGNVQDVLRILGAAP
ncbi:MlaD family protein [Mycolicibacterium pyrenivorans]|uniref:MlaD family protein n=1 Tax=Mycolicibacterium pyrenivorans TaxID=187102 RepID=UPI0021F2C465|nr:MlaD family protein [Mycolicibacterium pyrenivorans]MCV7150135.1 MCE family protein [Mycolicibacterium pyrenivorans]